MGIMINAIFFLLLAAFMSVLHMYESFGWWRRADYLKVHFAESWNEMHHLLIMEVMSFYFLFECMYLDIHFLIRALQSELYIFL